MDNKILCWLWPKKIGGSLMVVVGILGSDSSEMTDLFSRICQEKGLTTLVSLYKTTGKDVIPVVCIDENNSTTLYVPPRVWILQDTSEFGTYMTEHMSEHSYLVVNADSPVISPPSCNGIITYGFNGKASVTASSITDGTLQVCIQRSFKSLGQHFYEPQEFKALCPQSVNPLNVLGAVTACAVCDVLL